MAQYTAYANYVIFFQNEDEYNFALAAVGGSATTGGRFEGSPQSAAAFFDIPYPFPSGDMALIEKGVYFTSPFSPGWNIGHPSPSGVILDDGIDSFLVPGQAGVPASIFPAGPDMLLIWSGVIIRSAASPSDPDDPTPIARRRWCGGVEMTPSGEGSFNFNVSAASRNASRTVDGFGLPIRGQNNTGNWARNVNEYITGLITETSWERFYFRIRAYPVTSQNIWRCHGFPSASIGAGLNITPTGDVTLNGVNISSIFTVRGTSAVIPLNTWVKVDIFLRYNAALGNINVYFNGAFVMGFTGNEMNGNSRHTQSELGKVSSTSDNIFQCDIDDWSNMDWPANGAGFSLAGLDFAVGSHNRRIRTLSGTAVGWSPVMPLIANQMGHNPDQNLNSAMTSTTSGALIEGLTELTQESSLQGVELGAASAVIGSLTSNAANTDGQQGYSIAGVPTMITIDEFSSAQYKSVMYAPTGQIVPASIVPFRVRYTKSADANSATVRGLQASVDMLGVWNSCDIEGMADLFPMDFLHNCNYGNTIWGFMGPVPDGPCFAKGGTYVGNGTQQAIPLPGPCHFLWIRALTGGSSGVRWFGAGVGGNLGVTERVVPNFPVEVLYNEITEVFEFHVTGTNVEVNANAVTFQYIAFCDPGMRFNVCGAYTYPNATFAGIAQSIVVDDFLAEFGFAQKQVLLTASNAQGLYCKGPGFVGNAGTSVGGSAIANFGTFSTGVLNIGVDIHNASAAGQNYSLWRMRDTNCGDQMLQIGTYTGNGAGARTITLPLVSGRFPLFVFVQPTNGNAAYFRDPSHTGSNSAQVNNLTNSTTAITGAGVDTIQVNSTLNANAVVYSYFVICGDSAGFNNGTYGPPNCLPPESPWPEPPFDPPDIAILANGGLSLNGQTALTLLKDVTGIYTLVPGKTDDTLYDRQTGQSSVEVKIPNPTFKTGYIGG